MKNFGLGCGARGKVGCHCCKGAVLAIAIVVEAAVEMVAAVTDGALYIVECWGGKAPPASVTAVVCCGAAVVSLRRTR